MEKRIKISQEKEGTLIVIKAYKEKSKQFVLGLWLLAWTICGLAICSQLFFEPADDLKSMLFIFSAFWFYFEFKAIKVWRWRRVGEEKILIDNNALHYGRTYNNRGFLKPFALNQINPVRIIEQSDNAFNKTIGNAYWSISGETLTFGFKGRMVFFGLRLNEKEAKKIMKLINQSID